MYLHGYSFDQFFGRAKHHLFSELVDMAETSEFRGQFMVEPLAPEEIYEQVISRQRADGQFVLRGDFVPSEAIAAIVKQHCKKIILEGKVWR